ncbi:cysteine hydrolase (plasmid) [Rhizobium grahamii]|uniref:Cysteine hydrolase n=1 Tax=Rhizobium grahamii TaxID=1120045 RepID=A0A5Q0CBD2_9HYPH|nr:MULTISPECIES: cysteine hydrolase family protein [Rhizobium]QFY63176.1 cysteine hydrolase [Rhizobium grahamii]QRM52062.1 cysteine hydrolase [Rhizobium sp. BG6]
MTDRAILVIDLQNDYFPDGKLPLVGIEDAAANAARVIAAARRRSDAVIHVRHEAIPADAPFFVAGSEGAEIYRSVLPLVDEPVVVKNYPNAFRETNLRELLVEQGTKELVIVGAMSHMCIDAATRAAADLGFRVTVVHDACATRDLEFADRKVPAADVHSAFMAALAAYASLITTENWLG